VTGSKEVRAEPFVAQCQNDNVRLVAGDFTMPFIEEAEVFPAGKFKDQIDAAAGAFNKLTAGYGYDTTYAAWDPNRVEGRSEPKSTRVPSDMSEPHWPVCSVKE
jgi:hypothetical protein